MFLRNWPKVKENRQMNKPLCVFTKDISSILNSLMKTNSTQPSLNKQQHSIQCEIKTFMTTNLQINKANGKILVSPPETHMLHCGLFFRMMCRVYFLMRYVSSILITLRGEQWRKSNKNTANVFWNLNSLIWSLDLPMSLLGTVFRYTRSNLINYTKICEQHSNYVQNNGVVIQELQCISKKFLYFKIRWTKTSTCNIEDLKISFLFISFLKANLQDDLQAISQDIIIK